MKNNSKASAVSLFDCKGRRTNAQGGFFRTLIVALAVATLLVLSGAAFAADSTAKPNIIFILSDDLGYGEVGCYGQTRIKTPFIDKMAAEGLRFTSCYAGCTVCAPSRCTLMTGLHTGHARIRGNKTVPLAPTDTTVAKLLKDAGYRTSLVGKWGLGEEDSTGIPTNQGFDEFFGYLNQVHAHFYYTDYLIKDDHRVTIDGNLNGQKKVYSHDLFTSNALEFLERNKEQPFFLYLAYTIPHFNMEVPSDEPYSNENWPQLEKNKAAMITRMDRDIGRIFQKLKDLGIDEKTIVFFTSDNGPHNEGGVNVKYFHGSGPLRGFKRDLYEGGIREPSIARWPGVIKPGQVSDFPWAFWDFLPTACDLAHIKSPEGLDGISILPTLRGQAQTPHPFLYWEFHERGFQQAVRMGDWKAVRLEPKQGLKLYNLKDDIGEQHDIASEHPEVIEKIESYLKVARTDSPDWPASPPANAGQ
jgi:arylsulfatase A-like enzyme